ncbi:hypothetical protein PALB_800 [Pseudoalteromonas luteoviolacea B = ATCC 29581]|nr:hypothetical protein PALB_800 [Pseudoalteromonas luteoviolacea B = ATCC 29581]
MPIVKQAYQRAGIKAEFVELPAHRLLQEISAEHTDGDVLHAQEIFKPFSNIIKVGPPITKVDYVLLCSHNVLCDNSVLISSPETIVASDQSMRVIGYQFPSAKGRRFYQLNNLAQLPELLVEKRFNYAIYIVSTEWPLPKSLTHLKMYHLFESEAYHTLHKKHHAIAQKVGKALEIELRERKRLDKQS